NRGGVNFRQHPTADLQKIAATESAKYAPDCDATDDSRHCQSSKQCAAASYFSTNRSPTKKIEQQTSTRCHRFEYLTLLNTFSDATTRDRSGVGEYNIREALDSPDER